MASQVGDYHPKFEGGKVVSAVVMPPQAHRELQGKQNKTKLYWRSMFRKIICAFCASSQSAALFSPHISRLPEPEFRGTLNSEVLLLLRAWLSPSSGNLPSAPEKEHRLHQYMIQRPRLTVALFSVIFNGAPRTWHLWSEVPLSAFMSVSGQRRPMR